MNSGFWHEKIDDYLLNKLSSDEMSAVASAAKNDINLEKEIALRKLEFETSEAIIADDIRKLYKNINGENNSRDNKLGSMLKKWSWILAFIGATSILSYLLFRGSLRQPENSSEIDKIQKSDSKLIPDKINSTQVDSVDKSPKKSNISKPKTENKSKLMVLANQLYQQPNFEFTRSQEKANDQLEVLIDFWNNKEWNKVIEEAKRIQPSTPNYIKGLWIQAHAYFKMENFQQSGKLFEKIRTSEVLPYSEEAEWFTILTLVAESKIDTDKFKSILNKIINDQDHPHYEDAIKLKTELDN
ncbi:MAG: hypothetical protein JNK41_10865 [Saprospiraceae bacterium]|jgi:tetratricopeptide (TPR) repeat protein|nr:hypothetical protein [Saprospiraceae bacterium]